MGVGICLYIVYIYSEHLVCSAVDVTNMDNITTLDRVPIEDGMGTVTTMNPYPWNMTIPSSLGNTKSKICYHCIDISQMMIDLRQIFSL